MNALVFLASILGLTYAQLDLLCVGLPDNTRLPSGQSCSSFYECFDEVAILDQCPNNQYFNPETSECDDAENVECYDETTTIPITTSPRPIPEVDCEAVPDFGFIPSPEFCQEYFQCIGGVAYMLKCPRGLYFSPEILRCTNPDNANCVITTIAPPGNDISCDNVEDSGFIPSPVSCTEYYQCFNNVAYRLQCPRGLYFSPVLLRCTNPNDANCVITTPGTTTTIASGTSTTTPSGPLTTVPGVDVRCANVPDFVFVPSMESCSEYYQCVDREAYRLHCPRGMHFSIDLNRCATYSEANCAIKSPIEPSTLSPAPGPTISCDDVVNFHFVASPISCFNYYQCIDGNPFLLSCPFNEHFDESRQTCDHQVNVQCESSPSISSNVPSCEGVQNGRFIPSPDSCTEYFQCLNGTAYRLSCPRGLYFHERIQTCDAPYNTDCVTTPIDSTTSTEPPLEASCEGVDDFVFIEHPTDCALHYQCFGGQGILSSCPVGRYFVEAIQTCVDSELVDCGDRTRRPTTTQSPIIDPQCIGVENGRNVSNIFSCKSFYQCLDGQAHPRFCDDGLWFDVRLQGCDDPELVDCPFESIPTAPTVPPPPPTTTEALNVCSGLDGVYIGSPIYCERFYYCIEGIGFPNICPSGQWFDRELLVCRPSEDVECSLQTIPTPPGESTTTDSSPAGLCRDARNGTYVGNRMACGEFFVCLNGEPYGRQCQEDFWFNMNQQRCSHVYDTICDLDSIICNGVADGRTVRAPASCNEYVTCVDGLPYPGRCFNNLFFDEETNNCVPRENVECDLIISTEEPRHECDGQPDFSLAGSTENCSEYFVCYDNEIFSTLQCPPGQNFDAIRATCDQDLECLL